jgi:polar amino acid transport system permease protein
VTQPPTGPSPRPGGPKRRLDERRGGILKNVRPAYLILFVIIGASVALFVTDPAYRSTLDFLLPGVQITAIATVSAYLGAAAVGLVLAGLLMMRLGERTILWYSLAVLLLAAAAGAFFAQPRAEYVVLGGSEGNLQIVANTSPAAVTTARGPERRTIRTSPSAEAALEAVRTGAAGAALVRAAAAPGDLPELERFSLLPDDARRGGTLFAVLALVLGLLTFGAWTSREHPLAIFAELYVDLVRGIPMLVVLIYVGFVIAPAVRDATGGVVNMNNLVRGIAGLTFGYAAYMAEIFRAGIEAIPKGQTEAARSLGLSSAQTMRHVVLPQAIRVVVPPLGNEFIAMLKDSSLLTILTVTEITQLARQEQSRTFDTFRTWNTAALLYLALTLAASSIVDRLERRTRWGK